jgi:hypothetical protein
MVFSLLTLAWLGSVCNGFCLVYFCLLALLMLPGLHRRGLLDKYCSNLANKVNEIVKGKKLE